VIGGVNIFKVVTGAGIFTNVVVGRVGPKIASLLSNATAIGVLCAIT